MTMPISTGQPELGVFRMAQIRSAAANWSGDLGSGTGAVSATTSHAFTDLPVTWKARTEESGGLTSPEELVAAAHAACYSMSLANLLAKNGTPASRLDVSAAVTGDRVNERWTVVSSALTVRGDVPGVDAATFGQIAEQAKDGCPISRALAGNVELSVGATLS